MTPTDPDFVARLRAFIDWRNSHAAQPYQDLLTESLAALEAARQRDAELEAGALALSGALNRALTRERLLCDQLDTAEARVQQLEAALKAYGKHPANCPKGVGIGHYVPSVDAKCNCGIDAALGRADTPEPPHED